MLSFSSFELSDSMLDPTAPRSPFFSLDRVVFISVTKREEPPVLDWAVAPIWLTGGMVEVRNPRPLID